MTRFTRKAGALMLAGIMGWQLVACGTLLYPERKGQRSGRIDPGVAILNGVGLLLFVVPGLLAFAVDFSTGAIYLPGGSAMLEPDNASAGKDYHLAANVDAREVREDWWSATLDGPLTENLIETRVAELTGTQIDLSAGELLVQKLD